MMQVSTVSRFGYSNGDLGASVPLLTPQARAVQFGFCPLCVVGVAAAAVSSGGLFGWLASRLGTKAGEQAESAEANYAGESPADNSNLNLNA
ncbi:MAG: hypothetical protein VKK59_07955 [Vampirovibrionales bacterium]|nr:hypothetical protein [Vampirovibrionales bacterium]